MTEVSLTTFVRGGVRRRAFHRAGKAVCVFPAWSGLCLFILACVASGADAPDRHIELTRLSPTEEIWIDVREKAVVIGGNIVLTTGPIELLACPGGTKEHESIVAVHASTRLVHAGLLAIGLEPGKPASFDPRYEPADGPRVRVQAIWKDETGNLRKADMREWIRDAQSGKHLETDWVFAGGSFWTDPDTRQTTLLGDGSDLISVSNFATSMIDLPVKSSHENDALLFEAFEGRIPQRGTAVDIVLSPAPNPEE